MVLHTIADEEAVQFGTLNLLYSVFNFRGRPKPEGCHKLWNSFKRAVSSSELLGTSLKCTFNEERSSQLRRGTSTSVTGSCWPGALEDANGRLQDQDAPLAVVFQWTGRKKTGQTWKGSPSPSPKKKGRDEVAEPNDKELGVAAAGE